jgi:hypothetical protein
MGTVFGQKTVVPPQAPFWTTMLVARRNLLQLRHHRDSQPDQKLRYRPGWYNFSHPVIGKNLRAITVPRFA